MNPQLTAHVYSIWPEELVIPRAWQRYAIPPGSVEKPARLLVERFQTDRVYAGNQRYNPHYDDAITIANDIVNEFSAIAYTQEGRAGLGVWASTEDDEPSREKIEAMREQRDTMLREWLREGDRLFEAGKSAQINRLSMVACDILKENRPWRRKASSGAIKECPICGESVPSSASRCKSCGEIIDAALYQKQREAIDKGAPVPEEVAAKPTAESIAPVEAVLAGRIAGQQPAPNKPQPRA